ncbi:hypothetical protein HDU96_004151 [Phlyctochytrium bullatum]|nr:hypothetical protein HDU96_004151 [Phlyctochytrium bullatum]
MPDPASGPTWLTVTVAKVLSRHSFAYPACPSCARKLRARSAGAAVLDGPPPAVPNPREPRTNAVPASLSPRASTKPSPSKKRRVPFGDVSNRAGGTGGVGEGRAVETVEGRGLYLVGTALTSTAFLNRANATAVTLFGPTLTPLFGLDATPFMRDLRRRCLREAAGIATAPNDIEVAFEAAQVREVRAVLRALDDVAAGVVVQVRVTRGGTAAGRADGTKGGVGGRRGDWDGVEEHVSSLMEVPFGVPATVVDVMAGAVPLEEGLDSVAGLEERFAGLAVAEPEAERPSEGFVRIELPELTLEDLEGLAVASNASSPSSTGSSGSVAATSGGVGWQKKWGGVKTREVSVQEFFKMSDEEFKEYLAGLVEGKPADAAGSTSKPPADRPSPRRTALPPTAVPSARGTEEISSSARPVRLSQVPYTQHTIDTLLEQLTLEDYGFGSQNRRPDTASQPESPTKRRTRDWDDAVSPPAAGERLFGASQSFSFQPRESSRVVIPPTPFAARPGSASPSPAPARPAWLRRAGASTPTAVPAAPVMATPSPTASTTESSVSRVAASLSEDGFEDEDDEAPGMVAWRGRGVRETATQLVSTQRRASPAGSGGPSPRRGLGAMRRSAGRSPGASERRLRRVSPTQGTAARRARRSSPVASSVVFPTFTARKKKGKNGIKEPQVEDPVLGGGEGPRNRKQASPGANWIAEAAEGAAWNSPNPPLTQQQRPPATPSTPLSLKPRGTPVEDPGSPFWVSPSVPTHFGRKEARGTVLVPETPFVRWTTPDGVRGSGQRRAPTSPSARGSTPAGVGRGVSLMGGKDMDDEDEDDEEFVPATQFATTQRRAEAEASPPPAVDERVESFETTTEGGLFGFVPLRRDSGDPPPSVVTINRVEEAIWEGRVDVELRYRDRGKKKTQRRGAKKKEVVFVEAEGDEVEEFAEEDEEAQVERMLRELCLAEEVGWESSEEERLLESTCIAAQRSHLAHALSIELVLIEIARRITINLHPQWLPNLLAVSKAIRKVSTPAETELAFVRKHLRQQFEEAAFIREESDLDRPLRFQLYADPGLDGFEDSDRRRELRRGEGVA